MKQIDTATPGKRENQQVYALIIVAFIAGLCSIVYELLIATTVSYFLGDSVRYFSITIGVYMAAMGAGSHVSRYIEENLLLRFVQIEILLGLIGGVSIPALYFIYAWSEVFIPYYLFFTFTVGFLIGLEVPLITRLMADYEQLKINIANILSFDYLGALLATLLFPIVLLPYFGVYQSSIIIGSINMIIAIIVYRYFHERLAAQRRKVLIFTAVASLFLVVMFASASIMLKVWDGELYDDRVVYSEQTPYQKITLTRYQNDVRLFLNGNLQFSSIDEYRYHEMLVHTPMAIKPDARRILLLGAGDGLAIRELLKYPTVEDIVLVDLDEAVVRVARNSPYVSQLNKAALDNDKVTIIHTDAFEYVKTSTQPFDIIIADLPDPNNISLSRLYSRYFYHELSKQLVEDGVFITQATSPFFAKEAFWSIVNTLASSPLSHVTPLHVNVPSFGEWGFVLATPQPHDLMNIKLADDVRFINQEVLNASMVFPNDLLAVESQVNRMDRPVLLEYYLKGWESYGR